jgi:hypothetical protein
MIPGPAEVVPRPAVLVAAVLVAAVLVAAVLVAAPPALVRRRDAGRRDAVGQRYAAPGVQGSSAGLAAQPGGLLPPDQL